MDKIQYLTKEMTGTRDYIMVNGEFLTIKEANMQWQGKYLVARRVKEDRPGRFRLHELFSGNEQLKDGWYDVFSYTKEDAFYLEGFYFCQIEEVRADAEGHINFVLAVKVRLGDSISYTLNPDSLFNTTMDFPAFMLLRNYICSAARSLGDVMKYPWNFEDAGKKCSKADLLREVLAGNISVLKEVSDIMISPTFEDRLIVAARKCSEEQYPLLKKRMEGFDYFCRDEFFDLVRRNLEKADELGITPVDDSVEDVLRRVERVMEYWKKEDKRRKEERKKAKQKAKQEGV